MTKVVQMDETNTAQPAGPAQENAVLRMVRILANSRELTLFILVLLLVVIMAVVYPNNFPTAPNIRAVLLNLASKHE